MAMGPAPHLAGLPPCADRAAGQGRRAISRPSSGCAAHNLPRVGPGAAPLRAAARALPPLLRLDPGGTAPDTSSGRTCASTPSRPGPTRRTAGRLTRPCRSARFCHPSATRLPPVCHTPASGPRRPRFGRPRASHGRPSGLGAARFRNPRSCNRTRCRVVWHTRYTCAVKKKILWGDQKNPLTRPASIRQIV